MRLPSNIVLLCLVPIVMLAAACSDPEASKQKLFERGEALAAEGKHAEAIIEYRNALRVDALYGEARFALAKSYMATERTREAVREYIRAAELLPDRADVQITAANLLLQGRDFEGARKAAEAAVKAEPGNVEAQIALANALAANKDLAGAVTEIEEAIQLAPDDSRPYERLGSFRMAEGDRHRAEQAYTRAVSLDPRSIPAHLALGYYYWTGNDHPKAEEAFLKAVELEPAHPLTNRLLIAFYASTGRQSEAEGPLLRLANANDPDALLAAADNYVRTGRPDEARPLYEKLVNDKQRRVAATARLAGLDFSQGRRQEAHARLDEALAQNAGQTEWLSLKAAFLMSERRFADAEGFAKRAVESAPESAPAHYTLGLAQAALGQHESASQSFKETLRLNPRAAAADLQLSRLSLAAGDAAQAVRHAEAARQNQPQSPETRLALATALLGQGEIARAEREARALRTEYPKVAAVHALHGSVELARSNNTAAATDFERALALDPANLQALAGMLTVDLRAKRIADGRARIERALTATAPRAELLVLAGRFEAGAGDPQAAERHMRRAIEIDDSSLAAYSALAQLYAAQNRLDEARREYENIVARKPDAHGARTLIGVIYEVQNRPADAIRVYEQVVEASPRMPVAANNLAWHYAEKGENLDRALELAQSAKRQLPDNAEVDDTLGWVYVKKNMPELAVGSLENAVKRAPANSDMQYRLGVAYQMVGRPVDAAKALQKALDSNPGFAHAADARRLLGEIKGR